MYCKPVYSFVSRSLHLNREYHVYSNTNAVKLQTVYEIAKYTGAS